MTRPYPLLLLLLLTITACHTFRQEGPALLRGRLVLEVLPDPIRAIAVGEDIYEMSFDIIMREEGGVAVSIEDFTVEAVAFGTITVHSQTFPASFITERGYPSSIDAGKHLRFAFTKRWKLASHLLFSGASARIKARTRDANGVKGESLLRVGVETGPAGR